MWEILVIKGEHSSLDQDLRRVFYIFQVSSEDGSLSEQLACWWIFRN